MIDKINGNGGYDFTESGQSRRKSPAVRAYENTPGFEEAAKKKAAGQKKNPVKAQPQDNGVILDLSRTEAAKKKAAESANRRKDRTWTTILCRLFAPALQWLKNFWESDSSTQPVSQPDASDQIQISAEEDALPEALTGLDIQPDIPEQMDSDSADAVLPDADKSETDIFGKDFPDKEVTDAALKSRDLKKIEQLVTRNGTKHLAHNSDLLTYYDRRGRFVEMDETQKHRVLFGDKNILKL